MGRVLVLGGGARYGPLAGARGRPRAALRGGPRGARHRAGGQPRRASVLPTHISQQQPSLMKLPRKHLFYLKTSIII